MAGAPCAMLETGSLNREQRMTSANSTGPLASLKVIELGNLVAGPFCTRLLAEFGAEVIKIELPDEGDPIRKWRLLAKNGTSYWWYVQSRNKKCITLDCHTPEGLEILKLLLRDADVLVENFRPGTLDKWGLTAHVLSDLNPKLIVLGFRGTVRTGRTRNVPHLVQLRKRLAVCDTSREIRIGLPRA